MPASSTDEIITKALDRYERPLISYAKEITGDLDAAKDAVQETFLRLSKQNVLWLEERLGPWLFLVCRNCALDHVRKVIRFEPNQEKEAKETISEDPNPAQALMASEEREALKSAVAKLPLQQRELLRLKFEADLSYKEMGETLQMSTSHVGVSLHEAIRTLRRLLSPNPSTSNLA
jgi:RNA polymerase sigma factor (sigma-70 family)